MAEQESSGSYKGAEISDDICRLVTPEKGDEIIVNQYNLTDDDPATREYEEQALRKLGIFYDVLCDANPDHEFHKAEISYDETLFHITIQWKNTKTGVRYSIGNATAPHAIDRNIQPFDELCRFEAQKLLPAVKNEITITGYPR